MRGETTTDFEMSSTCVQGVNHPLVGYQQPSPLVSQSPEPAWNYNASTMTVRLKQEPMDEARNDSGITSGSDCPSASPGSDRSENNNNPVPNQNVSSQYVNAQTPYNPWYSGSFKEQESNNDNASQVSSGYQASLSPKLDSGDEAGELDDQGIRVPKVNSHGKIKVHKCKQCDFVAYTKMDFWEHSKMHIKGDKILKCPRCPFVTEYKHHLEYHLLNHAGAKPFKCDHCDYSCVNKSMLNSHLKSHSKIYQYRCADCLYETKYCHSLKLHLRKYKHKPAMVLNPDGSPNPLPIIDVYGTRRGPKVKKQLNGQYPDNSLSPKLEQQPPMPFNPLMNPLLNQTQLPFPFPFVGGFPGAMPNPELLQNIQKLFRERIEEMTKQQGPAKQTDGVLDLSKPNDQSSDEDDTQTTMFSNVEVVDEPKDSSEPADSTLRQIPEQDKTITNNNRYDFACQYCGICFDDEVLYRIHMGYHGYSNAFTCNMCGEECKDKVNFFLHIARAAH